MLDPNPKSSRTSAYPNIILKKKLAPLPLLQQNVSPKHFTKSPSKDLFPNMSAIRESFRSPTHLRSSKALLKNNFRSINNYGRLCDQPFLEFSSFHSEQVFGSGGNRKKITLEPIQQRKKKGKGQQIEAASYQEESKPVEKEQLISIQDTVEITQVKVNKEKKPKKEKDTEVIVKKVYKIGDYEAIIAFYSLQVVLVEQKSQAQSSIYVGKGDLTKVYKLAHNVIEKAVLDSLLVEDGDLKVKIKKKNKHVKQEYYTGDETYPDKSEELDVVINDKNYKATIHFPYLEISIPVLDYQQKIMLKADYLSNLFEEKFNNLQDYISKFNVPAQVYKGKDDIHIDALKNLPTIIKKVVKENGYGGLMLFKTMEIHLKNTSKIEPKTLPDEPNLSPRSKRLLKRQNSDINSILLRLKLNEVNQLLKCTAEEIADLVKESVFVEAGTGFEIKLNEEKVNIYEQREKIEHDSFPERSEAFTVRFQRFLYEGFVKFPTLEFYIPETTYKDVVPLKPSQLQNLLDNELKNMTDYLHLFKRPSVTEAAEEKIEEAEPVTEKEKTVEETQENKEEKVLNENKTEEVQPVIEQEKPAEEVVENKEEKSLNVGKTEEVEPITEQEKPVEEASEKINSESKENEQVLNADKTEEAEPVTEQEKPAEEANENKEEKVLNEVKAEEAEPVTEQEKTEEDTNENKDNKDDYPEDQKVLSYQQKTLNAQNP